MFHARIEDIDFTDDYVYEYQGQPFTGIACEYTPDGKKILEMTFQNGIKAGVTKEWYESGIVKLEAHYMSNTLHGVLREWYDNGKLNSQSDYELGVCLERKEWDEDERLLVLEQAYPLGF